MILKYLSVLVPKRPKRTVVIVTGLSGSGLSVSLKAFEDLGYETVDNLPMALVPRLLKYRGPSDKPLAILLDSRTSDFLTRYFKRQLTLLRNNKKYDVKIVFLECNDDILIGRFKETRRKHPLAHLKTIQEAINQERNMLSYMKRLADLEIDTSNVNINELRRVIFGNFSLNNHGLNIAVMSFSYKRGVPKEADLVFDVRFLKNPHYDLKLRPFTGQHQDVGEYIKKDEDYPEFWDKLISLLDFVIPRYINEGKTYLTIAYGCTGGKHRSVFLAETTMLALQEKGYSVAVIHREIGQK